jgi:pimeloyl-ACP methyl ester carboxylesterase
VPIESIENRTDAENIIAQQVKENNVVQFLMKGLYRKEDNSFGWRYNISSIEKSYTNILSFDINNKVFEGETLFIRGELSKYIQNKDWEYIHELFPRAKLETMAGAGHWLHAQKPKEFIYIVEQFL